MMGKVKRPFVIVVLAVAMSILNSMVGFAASSSPSPTVVKVVPPANPLTPWYPRAYAPGIVIDMSGVTFQLRISSNPNPNGPCRYTGADRLPINRYPVSNPRYGGTIDPTFQGGRVVGNISLTAERFFWGYCNSTAVAMQNAASTRQKIEAIRVDRGWDGFRIGGSNCTKTPGLCHNLIRGVWATNVRDDCVENDQLGGLTIQDSLFDGCFAGVSSDPANCKKCPASHQNTDTIELDGVLLRLQGFPHTYREAFTMHHVGPFKIHGRLGPQLVVNDSIVAFEYYDNTRYDRWSMGWKKIKSCRNNQLLWLPDAPFPPHRNFPMPPSCFTIKTGAAARAIWTTARATWIARHPEVARVTGDPPANQ